MSESGLGVSGLKARLKQSLDLKRWGAREQLLNELNALSTLANRETKKALVMLPVNPVWAQTVNLAPSFPHTDIGRERIATAQQR